MSEAKGIVQAVTQHAEPVLAQLGYELVAVEYGKQNGEYTLEFFLWQPEGIDLEDCERANGPLNELMDSLDLIKDAYNLVVSSPGDRALTTQRDFERNEGLPVDVKLYAAVKGRKMFTGVLVDWQDDIVLECAGQQLRFPKERVANVRPSFAVITD